MEQFEKLAKQYFTEERNYTNDLQRFASNQDVPPKTIKLYMSVVKEYLLQNDIEISQKQARTIRNKMIKGGARTIEKDLDTDIYFAKNHKPYGYQRQGSYSYPCFQWNENW